MIRVPDAASYATIHFLRELLDRRCGGSTGTNVFAALQIIAEMNAAGESGSVVSMICDDGARYLDTYYNQDWLDDRGFDLKPYRKQLEDFYQSGKF
jgi:cysteine synthase A